MGGKTVAVIGSGVAGLTLAYLLAQKNFKIILIERESEVGGLARSFNYRDGIFDIGPHRFHTDNKEVLSFIHSILKNSLIQIPRYSGVYFFEKYYKWPLGPTTIIKLPKSILFKVFLDIFSLLKKSDKEIRSFQDHIINMFGPTLYKNFFKDYSTKFLKITPDITHCDWAKTGIDRAIIDERLKMHTLKDLIFSLFRPQPKTIFLYPPGGIQKFSHNIKKFLINKNIPIYTNEIVNKLIIKDFLVKEIVTNKGNSFKIDYLIWTGSILDLAHLLNIYGTGLKYLAIVIFNIVLNRKPPLNFQWCYYGSFDVIFNRITFQHNFSPANFPPGLYGLCVEVTCIKGDNVWKNPENLKDNIIQDLIKVKLISSEKDIENIYIEKIQEAYPIYDIDYRKKRATLMKKISKYKNIKLAGRTGLFWYNNMDHSIAYSLKLAKNNLFQNLNQPILSPGV